MTDVSLAVGMGLLCACFRRWGRISPSCSSTGGAVATPDVEMLHPLSSAIDLFRSKWWSIGWGVAAVVFALHVAALTGSPHRVTLLTRSR
jgi:hypothetical protein